MIKTSCFLIGVALAIVSCNNESKSPDSGNTPQQTESDTADLGKLSIPKAKTPNTSDIPKYSVLTREGDNTTFDQISSETVTDPACAPLIPKTIGDLNSESTYDLYQFNSDKNAEAKAMGFSGTIGKKELLIVEEYKRWSEVTCEGKSRKFGVGVRSFIHVTQMKGGLETSLTLISAKVEQKTARATFNIKSMGFAIDGRTIGEGISSSGQYDVSNFANLRVIYVNTLKQLSDSSSKRIRPVELLD